MTEQVFGGHCYRDTQRSFAAEGRAKSSVPTNRVPPGHSFARQRGDGNQETRARDGGGHFHCDNQEATAAPDFTPFAGHHGYANRMGAAGEGEAIAEATPRKQSPPPPHSAGQPGDDNQSRRASEVDGGGQREDAVHIDIAPVIDTLIELNRRRRQWQRAQVRLTLQAGAICRRIMGGDKTKGKALLSAVRSGKPHPMAWIAEENIRPLLETADLLTERMKPVEKQMAKLAKQLPAYDWVVSVRGFGIPSFAAIVGEAGDIGSYKSVSALWKRMGLAVINGGRQRRVAGAEAIEHGYNPARRAVMWNIGDSIIKANGDLRSVYDERKAYEAERVESKKHAHDRAKRYMEKRLLRELWKAWRAAVVEAQPSSGSPPAITYLEAAE